MAVKAKGRRRIVVEDKKYVWYVKIDYDSPYYILGCNWRKLPVWLKRRKWFQILIRRNLILCKLTTQ